MTKTGFIYILSNPYHSVLYTGATTNLQNRVREHKEGKFIGFSKKYKTTELVYYEEFASLEEALLREKQLKAGSRTQKIRLIEGMNPEWKDLSLEFEDI